MHTDRCPQCQALFTSAAILASHLRLHDGVEASPDWRQDRRAA